MRGLIASIPIGYRVIVLPLGAGAAFLFTEGFVGFFASLAKYLFLGFFGY